MARGDMDERWYGTRRYVVSDMYAPQFCELKGASYTEEEWLDALLAMCGRDELIAALAAAARVATGTAQEQNDWTEFVLTTCEADLAAGMSAALADKNGPPMVFLARQPILLALRLALTTPAPASPGTGDGRVVASMLSHHLVRRSTDPTPARSNEPRIGGLPASLAMGVTANSLFNATGNYGDMLARTWLLWTRYESHLERYPPRRPLHDMVAEATGGLGLEDIIAAAFALFSHANATDVNSAGSLDLAGLGMPKPSIDLFLDQFAGDQAWFAGQFGSDTGEWTFLPFESRPLLRTSPTEVVVLDAALLQRRFTHALYWLVHDYEKAHHGDLARNQWTQTYSELIELHAEALMRQLAPILLGNASAFFTEEDLADLGGNATDVVIDFGTFVLVADVVQHAFTVKTRTQLDPDAFDLDIARAVTKKAEQLNGTIQLLLDKPNHPSHPLGRRPERVVPMVVEGAEFPTNATVLDHVRDTVRAAGYLTQPECTRLLVVTLAELEMLDALVHSRKTSAESALRGFAAASASTSLTNYLHRAHGGFAPSRSPLMQNALDEILLEATRRIRTIP